MTEPHLAMTHPPQTDGFSESQLVSDCRTDRRAFARLYDRYLPQVFRYLYSRTGDRQSAEDLTSQTFLTALEKLDRYRDDGHLAAWLITIARNKALDAFRKDRRIIPIHQVGEPVVHPDLLQEVIHHGRQQLLRSLLAELPEEDAELLRLRYSTGLPYAEIAVLMKKTEEAVKKQTYRILARLKSRMEEDHD